MTDKKLKTKEAFAKVQFWLHFNFKTFARAFSEYGSYQNERDTHLSGISKPKVREFLIIFFN
jgi:hypothetical protein